MHPDSGVLSSTLHDGGYGPGSPSLLQACWDTTPVITGKQIGIGSTLAEGRNGNVCVCVCECKMASTTKIECGLGLPKSLGHSEMMCPKLFRNENRMS